MATKWKNFTRNCWVKAVAVILVAASAGVTAWQAVSFANYVTDNTVESIVNKQMLFSRDLPTEYLVKQQNQAVYYLSNRIYQGDEEYISSGKGIDETELCQTIYDFYFDLYYGNYSDESYEVETARRTVYPADEDAEDALTDEKISELVTLAMENNITQDGGDAANFRGWLEMNRGVYTVYRQKMISEQLADIRDTSWLTSILENYDYYAYCNETDTTLTNLDVTDTATAQEQLTASNYPLLYTFTIEEYSLQGSLAEDVENNGIYIYDYERPSFSSTDDILMIGLTSAAYSQLQRQWSDTSAIIQRTVGIMGIATIIALLCFLLLCCGAGRKTAEDGVHLIGFDRIWTEVQMIAGTAAVFAWVDILCLLANYYTSLPDNAVYALAIVSSMLLAVILLGLILAQIRRIKARKWLHGFIIWRLFHRFIIRAFHWLYTQLSKTSLRRKIILIAVLAPLACAFWVFIPFIIVGLLYIGIRAADRFETVANGARDIRAGKIDTHIVINGGDKEIRELADNLNSISDGLNNAVATAVKSERLKAELISNVSHDIKTPLTSIITYIDLLKKCNLSDSTAREYIDILEQKAQRLRSLTGDLFDASKASSGAMKVELMQTDFDALLRQALGERSAHLTKANLDVRIQSTPPIYVNADGRLLWRILDNLLSNCARYALPGSRVYITIIPGTEMVTLTIKNISATELNISADELMERFTRGDRSRHTDGSGLGLSIARSLAELMGGTCYVEIDGDLFKAIVTIPKWKES